MSVEPNMDGAAITPFGLSISRRQILGLSLATAGAFALGVQGKVLAQDATPVRGGTLRGAVVGPITDGERRRLKQIADHAGVKLDVPLKSTHPLLGTEHATAD